MARSSEFDVAELVRAFASGCLAYQRASEETERAFVAHLSHAEYSLRRAANALRMFAKSFLSWNQRPVIQKRYVDLRVCSRLADTKALGV